MFKLAYKVLLVTSLFLSSNYICYASGPYILSVDSGFVDSGDPGYDDSDAFNESIDANEVKKPTLVCLWEIGARNNWDDAGVTAKAAVTIEINGTAEVDKEVGQDGSVYGDFDFVEGDMFVYSGLEVGDTVEFNVSAECSVDPHFDMGGKSYAEIIFYYINQAPVEYPNGSYGTLRLVQETGSLSDYLTGGIQDYDDDISRIRVRKRADVNQDGVYDTVPNKTVLDFSFSGTNRIVPLSRYNLTEDLETDKIYIIEALDGDGVWDVVKLIYTH